MAEITKNDKVYSYYKFERRNNYKSNLINSMGIFELPETFALLHSLFTTLGLQKTNSKPSKNFESL